MSSKVVDQLCLFIDRSGTKDSGGGKKPLVIPVFQSLHNVCLFAFVIVMSFAARWGKVFERVGGEGFRVTGVKCLD